MPLTPAPLKPAPPYAQTAQVREIEVEILGSWDSGGRGAGCPVSCKVPVRREHRQAMMALSPRTVEHAGALEAGADHGPTSSFHIA